MGSSVDRELDLEESHGRIAVVNDDENIRKQEEESFCTALQLVGSSVLPMSIQSAIELGVFDIIAKAGRGAKLSSSEIVAQIATENPEAPVMLDGILRFLVSYSVLDCSVVAANDEFVRFYNLNRVSKHFMPNEDGVSLTPMVALCHDKVFSASWSQLKMQWLKGDVRLKGPMACTSLSIRFGPEVSSSFPHCNVQLRYYCYEEDSSNLQGF